MNIWIMEYDFHLYNVNLIQKETNKRIEYHNEIETLLKSYREKKDALLMNCIKYNTNFKIYKGTCKEIDISFIDNLL